jgi:hypothetical protein
MATVSLGNLAYWEGLLLIGGLFAVVLWKLSFGELALDDLFTGHRREEDGTYTEYESAGRVLSFVATIAVAGYYLLKVFQDPHRFPDIPPAMVMALAGSQAVYLGGKAQALLSERISDIVGRITP